ncbi:hypothetical protein ERC79_06870 [Rhodococcus sp. ABRD24]|uniref:hypothetical protein n=1 Tax=Rhodococcus sp. ABRD24 TaxID=2507582 RepID=UPI00103F831D|nr:hypothetical protein [Rhodococcus sp. ABRD24]QBJ95720.1 hypothetical protein ERC79_06870 [Rhodococcus sp. ABRD24]
MSERSPRPVSVAYWIWVLCAALMVLFGLLAVTTSADAIRGRMPGSSGVDTFMWLLRGTGAAWLVFGLALGFLAAPVRAGDPRLRTVTVALSGVFALAAIAAAVIGVVSPLLLAVPILLLVASVLVYREGAREWFGRDRSG